MKYLLRTTPLVKINTVYYKEKKLSGACDFLIKAKVPSINGKIYIEKINDTCYCKYVNLKM